MWSGNKVHSWFGPPYFNSSAIKPLWIICVALKVGILFSSRKQQTSFGLLAADV